MAVGPRAAWVGGDDGSDDDDAAEIDPVVLEEAAVVFLELELGLGDWRPEGPDEAAVLFNDKEENAAAVVDDGCPW